MSAPAVPSPASVSAPSATSWRAVREAVSASFLLIALRWRMIRAPHVRILIAFAGFFLLFGLSAAINLGYAVRNIAEQGLDTVASTYAQLWVTTVLRDGTGQVGAFALGGTFIAAIFAPFTGTATLSLVPADDLPGLRLPRLHRYFDSLLINAASGVGLLQLISLTAVTSLLSLDGPHFGAMLVTWVAWMMLVVTTTSTGWALEWVVRRFGRNARRLAGLGAAVVIGIPILLDPKRGTTLFGLGDTYAELLRNSVHGPDLPLLLPAAVFAAMLAALLYGGLRATVAALALPAPVLATGKVRPARRPLPTAPVPVFTRLLMTALWRTPESRRPLVAIVGVGIPSMLLTQMDYNVETALNLAVPLAVSLSFGVNLLAIFGPGLSWLVSRPAVLNPLPRVTAGIQILLTVGLIMLLWAVAYTAGNADLEAGKRLLIGSTMSGFLAAAASLDLSLRRPMRARLSGRGDALVPPLTALGYLFRLITLACVPSIIVLGLERPLVYVVGLVGSVVISLAWIALSERRWANPARRSAAVAAVAAT